MNEAFPNNRNLENKSLFLEAVASTTVEEIATDFDMLSVNKLSENLKDSKVFIIGEMHGVKENIDVAYTLFKKFGFGTLALEWEPRLRNVAEKFLSSGEIDFEVIENSPDGRITAGHFSLIKKLKEEGLLKNLVCFDEGSKGKGWNERDKNMAKSIVLNISNDYMLVIAGNWHAKTEPFNFDGDTVEKHPMGENVKNEIPGVFSGKINYLSGQYHNYGVQEFKNVTKKPEQEAKFYMSDKDLYTFELPVAHAATVPNPDERLSS